jgi:sulfur carrier protein ThiS adenylyltransferase
MNPFEKSISSYFSPEQFTLIQKIKIGIAGAGGLGSNLAVCLTRCGFKNFEIIDSDVIETKNLNRQYYFLDEVGQAKVTALAERLKKINPDINIITKRLRLSSANIGQYFQDREVLFEAFDNVESKSLLLEHFGSTDKLLIFGNGMAGISNQQEIKIKKIKENIYFVGDGQTQVSSQNPPLAPRVTACAALMASCALEIITQKTS